MVKNKIKFVVFAAVVLCLTAGFVFSQTQPLSVYEMDDKSETIVLRNGDAKVKEVITMSASAYVSFKQKYPVLSMFTRIFKPANMPTQIENLDLKLDEGKNQIIAEYLMKGAAVNQGDHWEIKSSASETGEKIDLVSQKGNVLVFTMIGQSDPSTKMVTTVNLTLPGGARDIVFDKEAQIVTYKMFSILSARNTIFVILGIVFTLLGVANYIFLKRKKLAF